MIERTPNDKAIIDAALTTEQIKAEFPPKKETFAYKDFSVKAKVSRMPQEVSEGVFKEVIVWVDPTSYEKIESVSVAEPIMEPAGVS